MASTGKLLDRTSLLTWTRVRPFRNLAVLALDYASLVVTFGIALGFAVKRVDWGLGWWTLIPVWGAVALVNGMIQHRIALMGHEASHNLLVPNRRWNDILADLFCFYPLFGTLLQYRAKHLAHHLHPNDPHRDPNLGFGKAERLYAKFPMPKGSFIYTYYLKFFWPPFVLSNLVAMLDVVSVNSGISPYPVAAEQKPDASRKDKLLRTAPTLLGVGYVLALIATLASARWLPWAPIWTGGCFYLLALVVWWQLPEESFKSRARLSIPYKTAALIRLTVYTVLLTAMSQFTITTGNDLGIPFMLLWVLPLIYVFPYLMLLRDVFQHANAGRDEFDNSRIIHADPFTRWALLGYGNDFHLIHHIYPNIPHYNLRETHSQLLDCSPDYREQVEETHGIFRADRHETDALIDSLTTRSEGRSGNSEV